MRHRHWGFTTLRNYGASWENGASEGVRRRILIWLYGYRRRSQSRKSSAIETANLAIEFMGLCGPAHEDSHWPPGLPHCLHPPGATSSGLAVLGPLSVEARRDREGETGERCPSICVAAMRPAGPYSPVIFGDHCLDQRHAGPPSGFPPRALCGRT